ncbi:AI-2E family transporter [bacterium]|nr:AI-2E family transporter [bacterium]
MGAQKTITTQVIQIILIILVFFITVVILYLIRDILMILFLAFILSLFIRSITDTFEIRFRMPRGLALVFGILGLLIFLFMPLMAISVPFVNQSQKLLQDLPSLMEGAQGLFNKLLVRFPSLTSLIPLEDLIGKLTANAEKILTGSFGYIASAAGSIGNFFLMIALAAFFAGNPGEYREFILQFIPSKQQKICLSTVQEIEISLKHWLVGTFLAILFVGGFMSLFYWVIDLDYFIIFGIAAGFLEIIPYIGPMLGALAPLLYALIQSPEKVIWVLIIYLFIQFIEGYFFLPFIMRKQVNLPPAISILAIIVFGKLLGFLGILIGIPMVTTIIILIERIFFRPEDLVPAQEGPDHLES